MKVLVIVLAAVVVALLAGVAVAWTQAAPYVQPNLDQPLLFPHQTHVSVVGLDCTFCHRQTAQVTPNTAGYPSLEQCMFCHKAVATDRPRIQQLRTAFDNDQPINWVRVYLLPDHVHFVHQPHIQAGFQCLDCHPGVREQQQIIQAKVFRMGVCLDCHRANNARADCSVCHN